MLRTLEHAPRKVADAIEESPQIRLLDAEPDLARFLTPEESRAARGIVVPVRTVPPNHRDVRGLVADTNAFAALVLEGTLVHHLRVSDRATLRLLGVGDLYWLSGQPAMLLTESRCSGTGATKLALLGDDVLIATRRFPRLLQGLLARVAEQTERDAAHLAIHQLPRVEQRLIAFMCLLAEKWGYVTPAGTVVPLSLTHETLGGLIGASRPTVTLALGELAERGALLKHARGWLIGEQPPHGGGWSSALYGTSNEGAASNGSVHRLPTVTHNGR